MLARDKTVSIFSEIVWSLMEKLIKHVLRLVSLNINIIYLQVAQSSGQSWDFIHLNDMFIFFKLLNQLISLFTTCLLFFVSCSSVYIRQCNTMIDRSNFTCNTRLIIKLIYWNRSNQLHSDVLELDIMFKFTAGMACKHACH